jgi:hypothetical protein
MLLSLSLSLSLYLSLSLSVSLFLSLSLLSVGSDCTRVALLEGHKALLEQLSNRVQLQQINLTSKLARAVSKQGFCHWDLSKLEAAFWHDSVYSKHPQAVLEMLEDCARELPATRVLRLIILMAQTAPNGLAAADAVSIRRMLGESYGEQARVLMGTLEAAGLIPIAKRTGWQVLHTPGSPSVSLCLSVSLSLSLAVFFFPSLPEPTVL